MSILITNRSLYDMVRRVNNNQVTSTIHELFLSLGTSMIDGFFDIFNNLSGIYIEEGPCIGEDMYAYNANINTFSNFWNVCPFYWESENLSLFDDFILEMIDERSPDGSEEFSLSVCEGLEKLVYEVVSIIVFGGGRVDILIDKTITVPFHYQKDNHLLFREPSII